MRLHGQSPQRFNWQYYQEYFRKERERQVQLPIIPRQGKIRALSLFDFVVAACAAIFYFE
jgi:hypothetical protein